MTYTTELEHIEMREDSTRLQQVSRRNILLLVLVVAGLVTIEAIISGYGEFPYGSGPYPS